jgi:hypothetical protein
MGASAQRRCSNTSVLPCRAVSGTLSREDAAGKGVSGAQEALVY